MVEMHAGDSGVRFWALERGKTHSEWLSAAVALEKRRVTDDRLEKGSRLELKWTLRFMELRRSLWLCRPGQRVDGEGRHRRCGHKGGTKWHHAMPS
jgi:hypothetical protein